MIDKIIKILSLPKTCVIGNLNTVYNPYTLFMPYQKDIRYDFTIVTSLTPFQKRRIELLVPFSPEEEWVCNLLLSGNPVFALEHIRLKGATVIPDHTTRLVTSQKAKAYPFKKMYVPCGTKITLAAREQSIEFEEFESCEKEKFAEVFGQPKNTNF